MKAPDTLREWRKRRKWTQDQLSSLSGIDQTTISRLETDPSPNPTPDTRKRLAKALGIAPSRLRFTAPEPVASVGRGSDKPGHTAHRTLVGDRRSDEAVR